MQVFFAVSFMIEKIKVNECKNFGMQLTKLRLSKDKMNIDPSFV